MVDELPRVLFRDRLQKSFQLDAPIPQAFADLRGLQQPKSAVAREGFPRMANVDLVQTQVFDRLLLCKEFGAGNRRFTWQKRDGSNGIIVWLPEIAHGGLNLRHLTGADSNWRKFLSVATKMPPTTAACGRQNRQT